MRRIASFLTGLLIGVGALMAVTNVASAQSGSWNQFEVVSVNGFRNVLADDDLLIVVSYNVQDADTPPFLASEVLIFLQAGSSTVASKVLPESGRRLAVFYRDADDIIDYGKPTGRVCVAPSPTSVATNSEDCEAIKWRGSGDIATTATQIGERVIEQLEAIEKGIVADGGTDPEYVKDDVIQRSALSLLSGAWRFLPQVIAAYLADSTERVDAREYDEALGESPIIDRLTYDHFTSGGTTFELTRFPVSVGGADAIERVYVNGAMSSFTYSGQTVTIPSSSDDVVVYYTTRAPQTRTTTYEGTTTAGGTLMLDQPFLSAGEGALRMTVTRSNGREVTPTSVVRPYSIHGLPRNRDVTVRYQTAIPRSFWAETTATGREFGFNEMAISLIIAIAAMGILAFVVTQYAGDATPMLPMSVNILLILGLVGAWPLSLMFGLILVTTLIALRTLMQ